MKIEKISDNQIRCTLNKDDLLGRHLRLSELAYGTDRAKELFRDMMQQAAAEFGFEAEDIPLMIEAIPVSGECLVLVITKIEDPDELDTRFSKFTQDKPTEEKEEPSASYADEILNCFEHINQILNGEEKEEDDDYYDSDSVITEPSDSSDAPVDGESTESNIQIHLTKIYSFSSLEDIIHLAGVIVNFYHGVNSVYKDTDSSVYYLIVDKSDHTPEEFNKICNIMTEYGRSVSATYATCDYIREHYEPIVKDSALQVLSVM
ncbi:adaptor protein MecA [Anaerolentibacter hominis]|uniref:adaptor protein MecA n=1 Tax=Anaerolentibacter hominis TaxID=3079009 RepID=UPI0031B87A20